MWAETFLRQPVIQYWTWKEKELQSNHIVTWKIHKIGVKEEFKLEENWLNQIKISSLLQKFKITVQVIFNEIDALFRPCKHWLSLIHTLLLSWSKWPKKRQRYFEVYLIWRNLFAKKDFMSGKRNNPIHPFLSTWTSTWTEPEALYE